MSITNRFRLTMKPISSSSILRLRNQLHPNHFRITSHITQCASSLSLITKSPLNHHRSFFSSSKTLDNITPITTRLRNLSKLAILVITLIGSYGYLTDTRASVHSWLAVPLIKFISQDDPENAHHMAIQILKFMGKFHLLQDHVGPKDQMLSFELWGKKFNNPIGMAAGFDKNGDAVDGLFDAGFGYVEIGSVTPKPQPGNPKPRMFRIPSTESIINRYGFNSEGHFLVISKLRQRILKYLDQHRYLGDSSILTQHENLNPLQTAYADSGFTHLIMPEKVDQSLPLDQTLAQLTNHFGIPRSLRDGKILAVNLGKNKISDLDSIEDFEIGIHRFGPLADALVINISSPNTPGLRSLQSKHNLTKLLNQVVKSRNDLIQSFPQNITSKSFNLPAILIKIAPDLSVQELVDVGHLAKDSKIDGIIISNTTVSRPTGSGTEPEIKETGGLSGPPLKSLSLKALSIVHSITKGSVALIGCGGISRAEDVLEYGKAGANFVQVYSALTYQGIGLPRKLKDGLIELLEREENGQSWDQIVGSNPIEIDINKLIEEEKSFNSSQISFKDQVKDVKETIKFIDNKLQTLGMNYQSIYKNNFDDNLDHHQKDEEKLSTKNPEESSSELDVSQSTCCRTNRKESKINDLKFKSQYEPSSFPDQQTPENNDQRGILLDWKLKKQDEINRNDYKRVV